MAAPSGTITLNDTAVLVESIEAGISGISNSNVALVLQIGSGITNWAVNDIILYDGTYAVSFRESDNTYSVIDNAYIKFKYEAAP